MRHSTGTAAATWRKRAGALAGALAMAVTVLGLVAGPAGARERTVTDGEDQPAGVDITSVLYGNHERSAESIVAVRDLGDRGRLVTRFGPPDSDVFYSASVRVSSDGTLVEQLRFVTDTDSTPVACDFDSVWSVDEDTVLIDVPQRCLDFGRFLDRVWIQSTMYHGAASDPAKGLDVGRGDSPGCATEDEMAAVAEGQRKFRVHEHLDTAGKYGDAGAGSYARTYTDCDGGARWFVQYAADDDTVVNKGRVS